MSNTLVALQQKAQRIPGLRICREGWAENRIHSDAVLLEIQGHKTFEGIMLKSWNISFDLFFFFEGGFYFSLMLGRERG